MLSLRSYDESVFWIRLDQLSESDEVDRAAVDHLKSSIRKVAEHASWISSQVCRFMPQYTLHEERHFLNVLGISGALPSHDVIAELTPLECALPILAAYTHDLGMAMSQEEHHALLDESTDQGKHFASYRTRFDEELRQLERWRKVVGQASGLPESEVRRAQHRIDSIEGHILASYLRDSHTEDDQIRRLRHWLEAIKQETGDANLFRYGNFDYQRTLALIGISHGRGAPWLRRQLIDGGPDDRFFQPVATGESANLAFPGMLLRLADVMDFDASRAPRILFKHFGIENDQSVLEWNKHLSIVGWRLDVDPDGKQQPDLLYSAECQHPVHEKAIREFKTWIDAELSAVRIELDAQRRQLPATAQPRYDLHLPSQTRLDIRSARDPLTDQPKYVYHDLQFRLDQDEIQQLLMGESLYGDPGLCIRELLQNALDALELRELRLKMKQKGEAREPVDGELIRPGWVREPDGREEELRVTLDWGTDEETGQQWLRVTDNGVGMTDEVIKNYFTQIGKSFYRSPEFNRERAAMKAVGEVVSPISLFGIGILSAFMIADRLVVRTNPGTNGNDERQPSDIFISGPGSLFWLQHGSRANQGTEITLYIKQPYCIRPSDSHDLRTFLRSHFGYCGYKSPPVGDGEARLIDPLFWTIANAVWPHYAIEIPAKEIRVDDLLHLDLLLPPSASEETQQDSWECDERLSPDARWSHVEWVDADGPDATGSRLRLWFPSPDSSADTSDFSAMLPAIAESALAVNDVAEIRSKTMVNGMFVPTKTLFDHWNRIPVAVNLVGSCIWLDLRGSLAPRLTADRKSAVLPRNASDWDLRLSEFTDRAFAGIVSQFEQSSDSPNCHVLSLSVWPRCFDHYGDATKTVTEFNLCEFIDAKTGKSDPTGLELLFLRFAQSMDMERSRIGPVVREYHLGSEGEFSQARYFDNSKRRFLNEPSRWIDAYLERLLSTNTAPKLISQPDRFQDSIDDLHKAVKNAYIRRGNRDWSPTFTACELAAVLQESFFPNLQSSWPFLELFALQGSVGDATLLSPAIIEFQTEDDIVEFADPRGGAPRELVSLGYDLTFPMTAVPLGQLRRECGEWRSDRWYRPLGVAPFLLPALHDVWPAHSEFLQETFQVPHIYCLLPRFELWSKRFRDWTDADWHDPENLSTLWDLSGHLTGTPGQVLWTHGTHDINEMPNVGLPAPEFMNASRA